MTENTHLKFANYERNMAGWYNTTVGDVFHRLCVNRRICLPLCWLFEIVSGRCGVESGRFCDQYCWSLWYDFDWYCWSLWSVLAVIVVFRFDYCCYWWIVAHCCCHCCYCWLDYCCICWLSLLWLSLGLQESITIKVSSNNKKNRR